MKTQVKRTVATSQKSAATIDRNFRTFLLVRQFEAEAIGARIALARKEAGLTQEQLAEMASFSKRSLQDYEAGKTIPYQHMQEIGGLLKRDVTWFLHGDQLDEHEEALNRLGIRLEAVEALLVEVLALLRESPEESAEAR